MLREYWRFFWPLALTGLVMLLGVFLEAIIVMIIYKRFVKPKSALGTEPQSYRQKSVDTTDSLSDNV